MKKTLFPALFVVAACGSTEEQAAYEVAYDTSVSSFRFVYQAAVTDVPADAKAVRVWIPVPEDTPEQEVSDVAVSIEVGEAQAIQIPLDDFRKDTFGSGKDAVHVALNDIENGDGRSLHVASEGRPLQLELSFDVTRREARRRDTASDVEIAEALQPDGMIPLDGQVGAIAASLKTPPNEMEAARELYDHTLERMRYDKPAGGGWGRGDAEWACDARFGNCTDFHSYFMGLARAKGIPARFEMGFPVPGGDDHEAKVGGYHCWSWFWIEEEGWIPVDISEADKNPELEDYYFGTLDPNRVSMTGGRDLVLDPAPENGPLNFFVYPYAEVDGDPWDKVEKSFRRYRLSK